MRSARIQDRLRPLVVPILSILWVLAPPAPPVLSKTPGEVHCYDLTCHRVLTIAETEKLVGSTRILVASYYDDPCVDHSNTGELISSGEKFEANIRPERQARSFQMARNSCCGTLSTDEPHMFASMTSARLTAIALLTSQKGLQTNSTSSVRA